MAWSNRGFEWGEQYQTWDESGFCWDWAEAV